MKPLRLLRHYANPQRLSGPIIEAVLPNVAIGEVCEVRRNIVEKNIVARAQVIGFNQHTAVLSLIGNPRGLSREAVIMPTGAGLTVRVSEAMLGAVVDPSGTLIEHFGGSSVNSLGEWCGIDALPPNYAERQSIRLPLVTGVRAIDGLLTCGLGQRVGIFASAGCGKTMLMHMLIEHTQADIFVIGLIGERGREVTEFIDTLRASTKRHACVVVYASSDFSSVDRCNAALLATTVAEYFRAQGKQVVLFLDSITRYARALRDVALAAGEPPARRGYPASVFDALPRVLERPGITKQGSITAFYTILLEGDDEPDPIADEIRSILDGHIYLSRQLAGQGHFPAIDVLRSKSRVADQVIDARHQQTANAIREMLARLERLQIFLDMGEYKAGENADNDRAMDLREDINDWLRQSFQDASSWQDTVEAMRAIAT